MNVNYELFGILFIKFVTQISDTVCTLTHLHNICTQQQKLEKPANI